MDCPICGGEIPADSDECPTCGVQADESFLKEAFADLANGERKAAAPPVRRQRPEPSALKPTRPVDYKGKLWLAGGAVLVVTLIIIAVVVVRGGGKISSSSPDKAVEAYYKALSRGDLKGMLSVVAEAFRPTEEDRAALEAAFLQNTYEVSDLSLKINESKAESASVAVQNVVVKIKPKNGGETVTHSLVDEILQPAQQNNPGTVMLVMLEFYDDTWNIASQPNGGWSPDNIWALGRPTVPASAH